VSFIGELVIGFLIVVGGCGFVFRGLVGGGVGSFVDGVDFCVGVFCVFWGFFIFVFGSLFWGFEASLLSSLIG